MSMVPAGTGLIAVTSNRFKRCAAVIVNDPNGYFLREPPLLFPKLSTPNDHDAKYDCDNANGFCYLKCIEQLFLQNRRASQSQNLRSEKLTLSPPRNPQPFTKNRP